MSLLKAKLEVPVYNIKEDFSNEFPYPIKIKFHFIITLALYLKHTFWVINECKMWWPLKPQERRNYESIKSYRNYIFYLVHATTERKEFMIWDLIFQTVWYRQTRLGNTCIMKYCCPNIWRSLNYLQKQNKKCWDWYFDNLPDLFVAWLCCFLVQLFNERQMNWSLSIIFYQNFHI